MTLIEVENECVQNYFIHKRELTGMFKAGSKNTWGAVYAQAFKKEKEC